MRRGRHKNTKAQRRADFRLAVQAHGVGAKLEIRRTGKLGSYLQNRIFGP